VGSPVAGKTGTTEHSSDAWFIGYTPNLTTAVWMGYAKSEQPMVDFRGLASVQGGSVPAQLWHNFMASALASDPQYMGTFAPVYSFSGQTLTPPTPASLLFPLGMGTTTTSTTTTTTTTTVPASTTTTRPPTATTRPTPATTTHTTPTTGHG
jgi:penicillin-binding protein 1A